MSTRRPPVADVLSQLTGVRTSKLSFYPEFQRTARSLDRSVRALASASQALNTITSGPEQLVTDFVPAVADIMEADWAALVAEHAAFAERPYVVVAGPRAPGSEEGPPPEVARLLRRPPGSEHRRLSRRRRGSLTAPLHWGADGWGWLLVQTSGDRGTPETDAAIVATLANQVVAMVRGSHLLAERERLREAATRAYEEASAHAEQLGHANRQLREARTALAKAREQDAVDAERQRLARELHDSVAQRVLTIGMQLEWCRGMTGDEELFERLTEAKELARTTVETIRRAIFELSATDDLLPDGLVPSIRRLIDERMPAQPSVRLRRVGTPVPLPAAAEGTLLLVAREALFNVLIHARATRAVVTVRYDDAAVELTVGDNGQGDAEALRGHLRAALRSRGNGYHRGLAFLHARLREAGGVLEIEPVPAGGVRVRARVPVDESTVPS